MQSNDSGVDSQPSTLSVKTHTRFKLTLSFDGTNYCGWQRQPKVEQISVEQRVEEVLSKIYGYDVDVLGQGRTDAGVHALGQTAHVDLPPKMQASQLQKAMNSLLPKDITIVRIDAVSPDFHARFDAISRAYVYKITTKPNPLHRHFVLSQFRNFDLALMKKACSIFLGEHDFTSFSIQASLLPHARCTILDIGFEAENEEGIIVFHIKANRFLRRMVRRIVGSLLMVGLGRLQKEELLDLLANPRETDPKVYTAAAHGLALAKVMY